MIRKFSSIVDAISNVCTITDCKIDDVFGKSKKRNLYDARVLICGSLIELGYSIRFMSEFLNRHRATIHYYVKNYESIKLIYKNRTF